MARKKIAQHSNSDKGLSKSSLSWMAIQDKALAYFPEKESWRKRLIYSLEEWIDTKDEKGRLPLEIMQFCAAYKIPYQTFLQWSQRYEDIGETYTNIKLALASRRRVGAMHRDYDKDAVYKDLHRYDPEWDAINKYHAALKKDEAQLANDQRIVIIERFPESDLVPIKEKNNVE